MQPTDGSGIPSSPILVVDDDPAVRGLVRDTLLGEGFVVVEAEGGDHALRLLATEAFAGVVLDRTMPGLDGIEVLHWIRRTAATAMLPVLLVTGLDGPSEVVEGLDLGADDYLVKPFEPSELVARLRRHLRDQNDWADLIEREVDRRSALTEAARAAGSAGPVDQAAMQLCDGVLRLPGIDGAALVELVGDGISPIATKGSDPLTLLTRRSSRPTTGKHLARRARQGAWLEPAVERGTDQATGVAAAPVTVDDTAVALLLVAPEPGANRDTLDALLGVAIDFAALASGMLGSQLRETATKDAARQRFVTLVERHDFVTVYQPVVELATGDVVGYEALTRFDSSAIGGDDTEAVFTGAALVGAGRTVELRTLEAAIEEADHLPSDVWLSINVSPSLATAGPELADILAELGDRQVVIEVSELERIDDYDLVRNAIAELGSKVQLSVDDAGSGFATLSHVLALDAQYVKIDQGWVHGIHDDPAKRALVSGIQNFATETGAIVIAEGIETRDELDAVRRLGIQLGQGYLLGRPEAP